MVGVSMKLKYILKKNLNIKNGYLIAIMISLLLVVGGYFSYAVFTTTNESKGALNIITGNLYSYIDSPDLDVNKEVTLLPNEVRYIKMKLTNINTVNAKVNLYYSLSEASDKLEIGYTNYGDVAPTREGIILEKSGSGKESKTIEIRIVNDDTKNIKIRFGSDVGLETVPLDFPTGKSVLEPLDGNENLIRAYTYNQERNAQGQPVENFCVTGEEPGCLINRCYEEGSCPVGTIIRYRVSSNESNDDIRYFHVIKEDENHLTMQQRESTTEAFKWLENPADEKFFNEGPMTILEALDSVTSNWKYVNDQTFKMGETMFNDNPYTGYKYDPFSTFEENGYEFYSQSVDSNAYTMDEKTKKARMITAQEAMAFGCKHPAGVINDTPPSCPIWMYNYTMEAIKRGGTVESIYYGYWTMNIVNMYSYAMNYPVNIASFGHINYEYETFSLPARAVVEVNKR